MRIVKAILLCLLLSCALVTASDADEIQESKKTDRGTVYQSKSVQGDASLTASAPCCKFIRGNVDNDPGDNIDINDLQYLVDYAFNGGPAPECPEEADIDGNGQIQAVSDIEYLIDYMFRGGPAPLVCPK